MKFTVEVEDFYLEEEEMSKALVKQITTSVVDQIWKSLESKIDKQITMEVKDVVEKQMYKKTSKIIDNIIVTEKVKSRNNGNNLITLEEYAKEYFLYTSGWNSFPDKMERITKQYVEDFKKRYDLLFASQIVSKMSEAGLLKEEAVKLLMLDKK